MFFQQQAKPGSAAPSKPKADNAKSSGLAFSQYIGDDAAKALFSVDPDDAAQLDADMVSFREVADEIMKESLAEVPVLKSFRDLSVFDEATEEVPEEQPPDPKEPTGDLPDDSVEQPAEPQDEPEPPSLPPPIPPRIPSPKQPVPPAPEPVPVPVPEPEAKADPSCAEMAEMLKALEALTAGLEVMGKDILNKVNTLETAVSSRSDEIRDDIKNMNQNAVDFAKKIKENIHDAQLKDLEIQKKTLELMAEDEDRIFERAKKYQGLFGRE